MRPRRFGEESVRGLDAYPEDMSRAPALVGIGIGAALAYAVVRHVGAGRGHRMPGGIVIGDVGAYDTMSRWLLGSFHGPIAEDVAQAAPPGTRILEVGCGPGHLSVRLARDYGLEVVGLDLDPAMIERARANAARLGPIVSGRLTFVEGDVASMTFDDASFDLVISTLSMHHWDDPAAGLAEVGRVLPAGGRAVVWDLGPWALLHGHAPDPMAAVRRGPLRVVSARPWYWPWRLSLVQRIELAA
jgi:SAM-dependent methyltransferase